MAGTFAWNRKYCDKHATSVGDDRALMADYVGDCPICKTKDCMQMISADLWERWGLMVCTNCYFRGNIFTLLMKLNKCDFPQAVKDLCKYEKKIIEELNIRKINKHEKEVS